MIRRPPRSTQSRSSAASDVYKRQMYTWCCELAGPGKGGERCAGISCHLCTLSAAQLAGPGQREEQRRMGRFRSWRRSWRGRWAAWEGRGVFRWSAASQGMVCSSTGEQQRRHMRECVVQVLIESRPKLNCCRLLHCFVRIAASATRRRGVVKRPAYMGGMHDAYGGGTQQ